MPRLPQRISKAFKDMVFSSFLATTSAIQFAVVVLSGSVALLADMIHNVGDLVTAIPPWSRSVPAAQTESFDLLSWLWLPRIWLVGRDVRTSLICLCRCLRGGQLLDPSMLNVNRPPTSRASLRQRGIVVVFRIRVGRDRDSVALIADGYHAQPMA